MLERPSGDGTIPGASSTATRRWANDEDLLSQTITRPFADGRVEIAEGELAYGVPYQIAIFDVKGYQPTVLSGSMSLLAGAVTSRSVTLAKELRDPLRILSTTAEACAPPSGTLNDYGAVIQVTFNEMVEFVSPTWAEDFDNGVQVSPSAATAGGTYCPLKTSVDPHQAGARHPRDPGGQRADPGVQPDRGLRQHLPVRRLHGAAPDHLGRTGLTDAAQAGQRARPEMQKAERIFLSAFRLK